MHALPFKGIHNAGASRLAVVASLLLLSACQRQSGEPVTLSAPTLFQQLDSAQTHVTFANVLPEDTLTNPLVYEYTYNGGGIAIGDVNNDGLDDLYFTANKQSNKLYLNRGKLCFDDVTDAAGVAGADGWKTGVTMADVNGDGRLDIFVCRSGNLPGDRRTKQLFINEGNTARGVPRFTEQAARFGLADSAFSTQASFADFDRDGDLDMLLLNHSPRRFEGLDETYIRQLLNTRDSLTGVKFYQNDKGYFREATATSGIRNTRLSFGLGVAVSDVNQDGWPDIYLSNDYLAPDYLYINDRKGRFTDETAQRLGHTSQFSMGNNIADVNNDGLTDIITMDMLPEDNHRQKMLFANDNYELFALRERSGLHRQYMRNMLHLNNGTGSFSEIGQLAGIANTDWSWAPLLADFDNDGWKDLFVTNGYVHDYTNMDFMKYMGDYLRDNQGRVQRSNLLDLVRKMPSSNVVNYVFRNNRNLTFTDVSAAWGLTRPTNSNGAAYADLDNDGDLDLVVSNLNEPAAIFRNNASRLLKNNALTIRLKGSDRNPFGVGATVLVYANGLIQHQEQLPTRGFQSSVSPVLLFGTGKCALVDSVHVVWPSGREQWVRNVPTGRPLTLADADARPTKPRKTPVDSPLFTAVSSPVAFTAVENEVSDFKRQPLLPTSLSYGGPCMVTGDINGDGLPDLFVGGASGQPGRLFRQESGGRFRELPQSALVADYLSEDADAVFFDADHDGDQDLYVGSGGYDNFMPGDNLLQDRLYLNDGKGTLSKATSALPPMPTSTACVRVADVNNDGHPDLFVGGRVVPARYPETPRSYVLLNDGRGHFTDQTRRLAPALQYLGLVSDAAWADLNGDGRPDLVTVGEWLPIQIWINRNGVLSDKTTDYLPKKESGWWNRLLLSDINDDGKPDIIAGNAGLNMQCRASEREPAELVWKDFDDNGAVDPILCVYVQGKSYPYVSRDELLDQISTMRTRFTDYKSYADANLSDVFTDQERAGAKTLRATTFRTQCYVSTPNGRFSAGTLPIEAQFTPVYAIAALDANHDGHKDLVLGGNVTQARLKFGQSNASFGTLLKGDGRGNFRYVSQRQSGLNVRGDIRSFAWLRDVLLIGVSSQPVQAYRLKRR